jgi:hypothetical protein
MNPFFLDVEFTKTAQTNTVRSFLNSPPSNKLRQDKIYLTRI